MRSIITILGILFVMMGSALSQTDEPLQNKNDKKVFFYEWTDEKGIMHITDALRKIPEQYRSKARKMKSGKAQDDVGAEQKKSGEKQSSSESEKINADAYAEAYTEAQWRLRIRDWKNRLRTAENHYQYLEQQRSELFRAWGSAAIAPIENRLKAEKIEQQMKKTQEEIDYSRNMLEVIIPEEARKAGVPPGWLRE